MNLPDFEWWYTAVLLPVFGWIWKKRSSDLSALQEQIDTKASEIEVRRLRADVEALSDAHQQLRDEIRAGLAALSTQMLQMQVEIIRELGKKADR